jgi:hypothetical protein
MLGDNPAPAIFPVAIARIVCIVGCGTVGLFAIMLPGKGADYLPSTM